MPQGAEAKVVKGQAMSFVLQCAAAAVAVIMLVVAAWSANLAMIDHLDTLDKLRGWRTRARTAELRCASLEAELELARGDVEALRERRD